MIISRQNIDLEIKIVKDTYMEIGCDQGMIEISLWIVILVTNWKSLHLSTLLLTKISIHEEI